ncbi:MAG: A24 family peptidase [Pirellulales bacterium]
MSSTVLLLGFMTAAVVTDLRSHKIYNWTTYPGIVSGLVCAALVSLCGATDSVRKYAGEATLSDCLWGLLACGGCMLVCFVFFKIGGGDVKLMAMIGSFLGLRMGLEAMLWSFVLGGALALVILVWQIGAFRLFQQIAQYLWAAVRLRGFSHLGSLDNESKTTLYLAPSALVAVILVRFDLLRQFPFL